MWWEDAIVYEVYPRSFADAGSDGVGDLPGLRSRLGYLAGLGVNAVWLTPFYPSPLADGGYDVSDYCAVDPRLGTMADFDHLVKEAAAHEIRVIIDLVPNHCSSAHPLFQAALPAPPGSLERDRFFFRDGRGPAARNRRTTGPPSSAGRPGPGSPRPAASPGSGTCTCTTRRSRTGTGATRTSRPCSRT